MVGDFVGILVGDLVGILVGDLVGILVGDLVGILVGDLVGILVGDLVGILVGDLVGILVGDLVGILVGQTVPVGPLAAPNVLTLGPFQFGLPIVRCSEEQIGTVPLSVTTMFLKKPGGKHVCDSSPYAKASEKPLPES